MTGTRQRFLLFSFCISFLFGFSLYAADETVLSGNGITGIPKGLEGVWNPSKYISISEIKPGMKAYCLTEYGVAGIEKFGMEIVDIVHNMNTGSELLGDVILVRGTDERFIQTGPVAGCSGSPVYIDGRLAGALAFTWTYSKEPLYGATPIEEMLRIGQGNQAAHPVQGSAYPRSIYDFTTSINFEEIYRLYSNTFLRPTRNLAGINPLPCPLITSGIPAEVCEQYNAREGSFGPLVVAGGSEGSGNINKGEHTQLTPGACLCIPLVSGDIQISTFGTVTEVIDNKVYGFGHYLLGQGQVDLPMATGKIHTVVSNTVQSLKLASLGETVGALTIDEADGVIGQVGVTAETIPLKIQIDRYNDTQKRIYNCQLSNHQLLTPRYLELAVSGAAQYMGSFPPDHMIEYHVTIGLENKNVISFGNVSTGMGLNEINAESIGAVLLLMNNPFQKIDIESLAFNIRIAPKNINSSIWSVDLSDTKVKPGKEIVVDTILELFLAEKKKYQFRMTIPEDLAPGRYELIVCGAQAYEQFLVKTVPHRFLAKSMPDLIEALNNALNIPRDRLYCLLVLPPSGVTIEKSELPDLPATKAMILQDTKRTLSIQPYQNWVEKNIETGTVVAGRKTIRITVEQ
jgi:hypothetical protein